jgi:hypothetical protein
MGETGEKFPRPWTDARDHIRNGASPRNGFHLKNALLRSRHDDSRRASGEADSRMTGNLTEPVPGWRNRHPELNGHLFAEHKWISRA